MKRAPKSRVDKMAARDRRLAHDERATRATDATVEYDFHAKRSWAWRRVEALARTARKEEVQLAALREFLKRTDPEPRNADELDTLKAELEAAQRRGLTVNIAIVTGSPGTGNGAHAVREPAPDSGTIRIVSGNGGSA